MRQSFKARLVVTGCPETGPRVAAVDESGALQGAAGLYTIGCDDGGEAPRIRSSANGYVAVRTRLVQCSSALSSTMPRSRAPVVTTTAWTRSGGTISGWARWVRITKRTR